MMTDKNYHARRQALQASFDGPIPRTRLSEPEPPPKPVNAYAITRQIAERRKTLSARETRTDEPLRRLSRYLAWLVKYDRQRLAAASGSPHE